MKSEWSFTVSADVVDVEEHENGALSDDSVESETNETIKLTIRCPFQRVAHKQARRSQHRSSTRDETKEKIQDDDEDSLRELLIRYDK